MADVDNRRDFRGGGGRGFNKRKRFRGDDDDFDQGNRSQRPRQDAPPGTRIRRGLLEIAEDPLRLPNEVAVNIAKTAAENWEDEYVRDTFCTVALKLVVEQPFKIPFVAGVVLYANAEKGEIGQELLSRAGPQLQETLNKGDWTAFKLTLRFLACLSPLYEEDGVFPLLDELFNGAIDLQTASQDDTIGLELVKIILLTVPYLLASGDASLQQRAAEILEKTDIVASTPHPFEQTIDPYPTPQNGEEKPMQCASFISLLQRQLQDEANNGWRLTLIPRVYNPSMSNGAAHIDGESNGDAEKPVPSKHAFPTVTMPTPVNPGSRIIFPEVYFSLYADQDIESVPPSTHIASTIMRDAIADTINILDFNRNAVAKLLNEIDSFWSPGTFVKRATQFDKLRSLRDEGKSTWKPEDVAIDGIFSQIFILPAPEHRLVYYHSLVTESCKISPAAIAPSLGRAIRFLFRNVDLIDVELAYRYLDWFAHHLSNFEFRWKWQEWTPDVDLPDLHPKKAFINGALDKEIRLSFAKRIRETLPEVFRPLVTAEKEKDIPDFKFSSDQTPYAVEARQILQMLKKREPEEAIQNVIDNIHQQAVAQGGSEPLVASTDVYMTCILSIGSKSLSHALSTIDRCKDRLLAIGKQSEAARRQIITSVVDFWHDHPGTAVNLVDKLLNYTIITPMSVIQWALQDNLDRGRALASTQIYEMVSSTMFKVTNRMRAMVRERSNMALSYSQRTQLDEALPGERQGMRDMFAFIIDAVAGVATGASDEMIEQFEGGEDEVELIKLWGQRWERMWKRKAAVVDAIVGEGALGPLLEDPEPEPVAEPDEDPDMDIV